MIPKCLAALMAAIFLFFAKPTPAAAQDTARYYLVVYAFQKERGPIIGLSHTWATFAKLTPATADAPARISRPSDWRVESVTISWLPRELPICLICPPVPGKNYTSDESFRIGLSERARLFALPTTEVRAELYDKATARVAELARGGTAYVVLDGRYRPNATNCLHAVMDVHDRVDPARTGTLRGIEASRAALRHLMAYGVNSTETPAWLKDRLVARSYPVEHVGP